MGELIRQAIARAYLNKWIQNTNPADIAAGPSGYCTPTYIENSVLGLDGRYTVVDMGEVAAQLAVFAAENGGGPIG